MVIEVAIKGRTQRSIQALEGGWRETVRTWQTGRGQHGLREGMLNRGNRPELSPQAGVRADQNSWGYFDAKSSIKTILSPFFCLPWY